MTHQREPEEGTLHRFLRDMLSQTSGALLLVFSAVLFLAGAVAGLTVISRLGGAGWVMYAVVIGTWALVFGPVVASAATLRERGSKRHREAKRVRIAEQRAWLGINDPDRERSDDEGSAS
jgi:hypothetical protein